MQQQEDQYSIDAVVVSKPELPDLSWAEAWGNKIFRIKTVSGSLLLLCVLSLFPAFFSVIEKREGWQLNDRLLEWLPVADVSIITFIIIWSVTLLLLVRCVQRADIFLVMLWSFLFLLLSRMLSISLLPLSPPERLIVLKDPLTSIFYGGTDKFITKDLFYSGHTSIQFLIFLCLRRRTDKLIALLSSFAVACLVLIQHVHYTIDVIAAFPITYIIYRLGKWIGAC